jgi:hypothetical protein
VNPTEHPAKTPMINTGLVATLRGLLRAGGSSGSSTSPAQGTAAPSHRPAALASHPKPPPADQAHPLASVGGRRSRAARASIPRHHVALTTLCAALLTLAALAASSALAEETHTFSTSFGASGSAAGQLSLRVPQLGEEHSGSGLAINDETGDVYVADTGNHRVDEFTSSGAFIRAWGWGVINGENEFQICTSTCGAGISGSQETGESGSLPGQFEDPTFIAVDNSPGGEGNVYVGDTGSNGKYGDLVTKFDSSGHLLTTWGKKTNHPNPEGQLNGQNATSPLEGPFGDSYGIGGIAVGSGGTLYVLSNGFYSENSRSSAIFEFHPDGTYNKGFVVAGGTEGAAGLAVDSGGTLFEAGPANSGSYSAIEEISSEEGTHLGLVGAGAMTFGLAFDPSSSPDDLYVDHGGEIDHYAFNASSEVLEPGSPPCLVREERGNTCNPTDFFGFFGPDRLSQATGVAVEPSNHDVYVGEAAKNRIDVFAGPLIVPDATTQPATGLNPNGATLNGHLNPASGGKITECSFEWGETEEYGHSASCSPAPPYAGEEEVSAKIEGLGANATYHYRLTTANANGAGAGSDQTLTTLPAVSSLSTNEATEVGPDFATLNGVLTPEGTELTECTFQYLTQAAYEQNGGTFSDLSSGGSKSCAETPAEIGTGPNPVEVHAKITGLSSQTLYIFRIVAANQHGTTRGDGQQFNTLSPIVGLATEPATEVGPASATLNGVLTPDAIELTECFFEYGETEEYGHKVSCEETPHEIGTGPNPVEVHAKIVLTPDTSTHFRIVASNSVGSGYGSDQLIPIPTAEADAVHTMTGDGKISVWGIVDPNGADAHYHFEFVTERQFEESGWAEAVSTSEQDAGSQRNWVGAEIPALTPATTYRFRLTVEGSSAVGDPQSSPAKTLLVPASAVAEEQPPCPNEATRYSDSARLPDCRAYEQVTPSEKEGAQDVFAYGEDDASAIGLDGEHFVMYNTLAKWGKDVSGGGASTYGFTRTPSGWKQTGLSPQPETAGVTNTPSTFFSPDLTSQVLIERDWETSLINHSPERELDLGSLGGPYTKVASEPFEPGENESGWVAQSRDGKTAVLQTSDHELLGHPSGTTSEPHFGSQEGYDLYEYSAGHLHQVNVLSDGEPISTCGAAIAHGLGEHDGQGTDIGYGGERDATPNSISSNGSRIFFFDTCTNHLYMRLNGDETIDIGAYRFEGANPEGTRLLLAKETGTTLEFFSYETATETAKHLFSIPDATPSGINEPGNNDGYLLSEDGNVLYIRTPAVLTPEAPHGQSAGGENAYRYEISAEKLTFVGNWEVGDGTGGFYTDPSGRYLYFGSRSVSNLSFGPSYQQLLRYDSVEDVIQCITCASTFNKEPQFPSDFMSAGAASVNKSSPLGSPASANGDYVFFDAESALVHNDIDGELGEYFGGDGYSPSSDVYEWRKNGIDGCTNVQGCLALITNGIDGSKNILLGTDPSGRDVFIATHSQLTPTDHDTSGDVYDARIGGGYPPPPPPSVQCEGDACHNPPNPPNPPNLSSSTYDGPGNEHHVPPKEKKKHHKHHKAKKKSHKRSHGPAAGHNRGGAK